jgi:hypothetical protein
MIDLLSEDLISLTNATALFPPRRRGKKPNISTLYRWAQRGCRGVTLESIQVGGTRCTSRQALARFIDALTQQSGNPHQPRQRPAPDPRRLERVEQELERAGI